MEHRCASFEIYRPSLWCKEIWPTREEKLNYDQEKGGIKLQGSP
jgi:hypothetical protein